MKGVLFSCHGSLWGRLERRCGMPLLFVYSGRCGKSISEEPLRVRSFLFIGIVEFFVQSLGLVFSFHGLGSLLYFRFCGLGKEYCAYFSS